MAREKIVVDLCCGAGGLSQGFKQAGFEIVAGVDIDKDALGTYRANFGKEKGVEMSLSEAGLSDKLIGMCGGQSPDVVVGGPPCQGFSIMGKRDINDPRSEVLLDFAKLAVSLSPQIIVLENVTGLLQSWASEKLSACKQILTAADYHLVAEWQLVASDYGVPQKRERLFVIAAKRDKAIPVPKSEGGTVPTVWDAIGDLAKVGLGGPRERGEYRGKLGPATQYAAMLRGEGESRVITGCKVPQHSKKVKMRFRKLAPGTYESESRLYRLKRNGQCPTIRAGTRPDRGSFMAARPIHPTQPRCLTVREAARLHSYPDSFSLPASHWHGFRQIGNSVPPKLAEVVAKAIQPNLE